MGKEHIKYLDTYKELEGILRDKGLTVQQLEAQMGEGSLSQQKLRMCRLVRNFLTHEKDGIKFIAITGEMQKFIEQTILELDGSRVPLSKKMFPLSKCLMSGATIQDAALFMKNKNIPSVMFFNAKSHKVEGVITMNDIICVIADGNFSKTYKVSKLWDSMSARYKNEIMKDIIYMSHDKTVYDAECERDNGASNIIITKNGLESEEVMGIYI